MTVLQGSSWGMIYLSKYFSENSQKDLVTDSPQALLAKRRNRVDLKMQAALLCISDVEYYTSKTQYSRYHSKALRKLDSGDVDF